MKYDNGSEVRLGDLVDIGKGEIGVVIAIIDDRLFSEGYSSDNWPVFQSGVMIETVQSGPVHYDFPDEDTILLKRRT
jgi:hypothetical protein